MAISNYPSGGFTYVTNTYNTGRFRRPQGAWANDTEDVADDDPVLDRSGAGNDLNNGLGVDATEWAQSGTFGVRTNGGPGFLTAAVPSDFHMIGWQDVGDGVLIFRRSLEEFSNVSVADGVLTLEAVQNIRYWQLRINTRCFTTVELDAIELAELKMQEIFILAPLAIGRAFPEVKWDALVSLTGIATLPAMPMVEKLYLEGLGHTAFSLPELWQQEFATEGATTGAAPDRAYAYLEAKGFTQVTLVERWYFYWLARV